MATLKVNSQQVIGVANKIKGINGQIKDEFRSAQNAVTRLDNVWDGAAASNAISKFNAIRNAYCDARYNVVDNFVAFLYEQVGEGYAQTEAANTSLADAFK